MGPEFETLKSAFATNTNWAEWCTLFVFLGLVGDIVVIIAFDCLDPTKSWTEITLAGVASLIIAAGVYGEWHFGGKATEASKQLQAISEKGIAKLNKEAAQLLKEAASAVAEQEKLKRDNLNLAKALQPRSVGTAETGGVTLTGGLDRFAGTKVLIQSVPDWESTRLAADIFAVLAHFVWRPKWADASVTSVSALSIKDGLEIFTMRSASVLRPRPAQPGTEVQKRSALAAEVLSQYLEAFEVHNAHWGLTSSLSDIQCVRLLIHGTQLLMMY